MTAADVNWWVVIVCVAIGVLTIAALLNGGTL